MFLQNYNYEVIYKPGKSNCVADALSRREYEDTASSDNDDSSVSETNNFNDIIFAVSESMRKENFIDELKSAKQPTKPATNIASLTFRSEFRVISG